MGGSLSPEKQQLITTLLKERVPYQDIVERVKCSRRTVVNYASNLKRFGAIQLPVYTRIGRKPTFTEEMKDVCRFFIPQPPSNFYAEITES